MWNAIFLACVEKWAFDKIFYLLHFLLSMHRDVKPFIESVTYNHLINVTFIVNTDIINLYAMCNVKVLSVFFLTPF